MEGEKREKLREARFKSGFTGKKIATELGFKNAQPYYFMEAGRREITVGEALVLAELFKTTCEELFFAEKYRVLSRNRA